MAFGFGAGLVPVAPGTAGTALGVGFYLFLFELPLGWYVTSVLLLFLLGVGITHIVSRELGIHDHPAIVWDEVVGYLVTMIAAPPDPTWLVAGFVLFRVFDILKPWPIRQIDRGVSGGLGVMLDDLVGGIYALAVLQGVHGVLKIMVA